MKRSLTLVTLALAIAGCSPNELSNLGLLKSPTAPVVTIPDTIVTIGGTCGSTGATIQCIDSSLPPAEIASVSWRAISSAGVQVGGAQARRAGDTVTFSGLPADTYTIRQTVTPDQGDSATQDYPDLVIEGSSLVDGG